jgi:hypothetical protein
MKWWESNKDCEVEFAVNSNLGQKQELVDELIKSTYNFKKFHLYTSNESVGAHSEYIRDGLDWRAWVDNVNKIAASGRVRRIHVMNTVNALCLDSLPEFLELIAWFKNIYGHDKISFTLNILRFPSFQSPLVLSDELRTHYRDRLVNFSMRLNDSGLLQEHEQNHIQRLVDYLDVVKTPHSEAFDLPKLLNDFREFYTQYDQRRNKNFAETFPRLKEWYNDL